MAKLSDKQRQFCIEFLIDMNGSAAAVRSGYSPKTARQQAQRLLTKVDIQKHIKELQAERAERCKITADEIVERLVDIANQWQDKPAVAVRSLEILCRLLGFFEADNRQQAAHQILVVGMEPLPNETKTIESAEVPNEENDAE